MTNRATGMAEFGALLVWATLVWMFAEWLVTAIS